MPFSDPSAAARLLSDSLPSRESVFLLETILKQVSMNLEKINENQASMAKELHEANIRIAKIETREERFVEFQAKISNLEAEINMLQDDKVKKDSRLGVFHYFVTNWSGIVGGLTLIAILFKILK